MRSITNATFETTVLRSDKPVLVAVMAKWAPPCQDILPALEAVADDEDLVVATIDVDAEPDLVARIGSVTGVPLLRLYVHGESTWLGATSEDQIRERIRRWHGTA